MNKTEIRNNYKAIRKSIENESKILYDRDILKNFLSLDFIEKYDTFLCYASTEYEADTWELIDCLLKKGKRTALPRVIDRERMEFIFIKDTSCLEKSPMGISEPSHGEKYRKGKAVCIVPGLCFDENGVRVGYGGGYYDRFLQREDILKVGFSYSCQLNNYLMPENNDISMDYIVTEKNIIRCFDNTRRFI